MRGKSFATALLAVVTISSPAFAQWNTNPNDGRGAQGSGPVGGGSPFAPADNAPVQTYLDIEFKVKSVIKDVGSKGYRLMLDITEKTSPRRRVSFVPPEATLSDDMGNTYILVEATPVRICGYRSNWDEDLQRCAVGRSARDLNQLASNVPIPVTLLFAPKEKSVNPDTVPSASKAMLSAAFVVVKDKEYERVDVLVPNINLP